MLQVTQEQRLLALEQDHAAVMPVAAQMLVADLPFVAALGEPVNALASALGPASAEAALGLGSALAQAPGSAVALAALVLGSAQALKQAGVQLVLSAA